MKILLVLFKMRGKLLYRFGKHRDLILWRTSVLFVSFYLFCYLLFLLVRKRHSMFGTTFVPPGENQCVLDKVISAPMVSRNQFFGKYRLRLAPTLQQPWKMLNKTKSGSSPLFKTQVNYNIAEAETLSPA